MVYKCGSLQGPGSGPQHALTTSPQHTNINPLVGWLPGSFPTEPASRAEGWMETGGGGERLGHHSIEAPTVAKQRDSLNGEIRHHQIWGVVPRLDNFKSI